MDVGRNPQDHQIINEISTFLDYGMATTLHGVDHDLDGFFGELFCDFAATGAKEPQWMDRRAGTPSLCDKAA